MRVLKCLIAFSLTIFMISCTSEETGNINIENSLEGQDINPRNITYCSSPEPVTYTVSGDEITVNTIVNSNVNFIAVHKASNFAFVEALCDYWGGVGPCGPNLTSGSLADDDYLLKVATSTDFCWIAFTIDNSGSGNLVDATYPGNGVIDITGIDASVTRLDVHNLDYSTATPVSSICNTWSTTCNAPLNVSGFSAGSRLLRIETNSGVTFEPITIN